MLVGTDAGTGVRGHVGVWGGILLFSPTVWAGSGGRAEGHTHRNTHTHTQRNVHANVAPTPLATYPLKSARLVRGLLGTGPPDPTLESASPSPPQGSIWHRFNIDSTLIRHRFPDLTLFRCRINVESMLNRCQIDP